MLAHADCNGAGTEKYMEVEKYTSLGCKLSHSLVLLKQSTKRLKIYSQLLNCAECTFDIQFEKNELHGLIALLHWQKFCQR